MYIFNEFIMCTTVHTNQLKGRRKNETSAYLKWGRADLGFLERIELKLIFN